MLSAQMEGTGLYTNNTNMHNTTSTFQGLFLERLSQRFKTRSELVREVSKVLHVGRDAVYRRLRGDTAVTADELMLLADTFKVRMEVGTRTGGRHIPILRYPEGQHTIADEYDYFLHVQECFQRMKPLGITGFDFASAELPLHYELATPTLRSFKIFMFGITAWNLDKWKQRPFSTDLIGGRLHRLIDHNLREQYTYPARELWSIGVLDVTLRQINYIAQVGRFADPQDIERIFEELLQVVDHLERMVYSNRRFPLGSEPTEGSPSLRVYHNELTNTSNVVLVKSAAKSCLFTTLFSPNYLASTDPVIADEVQGWFDNLVEHGNALHLEAGKYAAQYFQYLRRRIREQRERIEIGQLPF